MSPNLKKLTYTLLQRKKEFYCDAESNAIDKLERFRLLRRIVDKYVNPQTIKHLKYSISHLLLS